MIEKEILLEKNAAGSFFQTLFGDAGVFEKTAGAPPFADWETGPELRKFIGKITAAQRKSNCYVLLNALSACEYFGSNINSDAFPWSALAHQGKDYGYQTFLDGHFFMHHKNKDPKKAIGKPVLSVLNHRMKRVELIVELWRERARLLGQDTFIIRVDGGEFPDVSMGCKVPWDECSICGHHSKTKKDYCKHMKPMTDEDKHLFGPNRILPDGRRVCVYNTIPRFFDISGVFIGAEKSAKVMAKLASRGNKMCFGDVCEIPQGPIIQVPEQLAKTSSKDCGCGCSIEGTSEKIASMFGQKTAEKKLAEIIKNIPLSPFSTRKLPEIERVEQDLPKDMLDDLAEVPLSSMLAGTAGAGVILKPHEFQRVVLKRMGENALADKLGDEGKVFRNVPDAADVGMADDIASSLKLVLPKILSMVKQRTAFGEPFRMRIIIVKKPKIPLPTPEPIEHPLLDKISAAYNGYRRDVLMKLSQVAEVVESNPRLREVFHGDELVKGFSKQASASPLVSRDSIEYLMGAHYQDRDLFSNNAVAYAMVLSNEGLLNAEEMSA
jgi:hypothetical protein